LERVSRACPECAHIVTTGSAASALRPPQARGRVAMAHHAGSTSPDPAEPIEAAEAAKPTEATGPGELSRHIAINHGDLF
jgi:hypothetical protein